ncbi:hypothetical protein VCSRO123_2001 [Vibrio cholerae]|nr:hypothetical protein [Vibrio cholerae]GHZ20418.1 hypothetical protein VCSRO123_2001 [Vibrio cholerae]
MKVPALWRNQLFRLKSYLYLLYRNTTVFASVTFAMPLLFVLFSFYKTTVILELSPTKKADTIQLFYTENGNGFSEVRSDFCFVKAKILNRCKFEIPENTDSIRIDFGVGNNKYLLSSLILKKSGHSYNLEDSINNEISNSINYYSQDSLFWIDSIGNDPYAVFSIPLEVKKTTNIDIFFKSFTFAMLVTVFTLVLRRCFVEDYRLGLLIVLAIFIRCIYAYRISVPIDFDDLYRVFFDEGTYNFYVQMIFDVGVLQYFQSISSVEIAPGILIWNLLLLYASDGSVLVARLINIILLTSAISLNIFLITKLLFKSRPIFCLIPVLLFCVYSEAVYFSSSLLTEIPFITLFTLFVLSLLKLVEEPSEKNILWMLIFSFSSSLAMLTRYIIMPYIVCLVIFSILLVLSGYRKFVGVKILIASSLSIALISPFIINGYNYTGSPTVATGSGAVLWLGSRLDTMGDEPPYYGKNYDTNLVTNGLTHISVEGDKLLKEAALNNIREHTSQYVLLSLKRIGRLTIGSNNFWFFPQKNIIKYINSNGIFAGVTVALNIVMITFITVIGSFFALKLGLQSLIMLKRGMLEFFLLSSLSLFIVIVYIPFLVNQRYGLPVFCLNIIWSIGYFLNEKQIFSHMTKFLSLLSFLIIIYIFSGI